MSLYMLLLKQPAQNKRSSEQNYDVIRKKYQEWTQDLVTKGVLVGANKLQDGKGRTLRWKESEILDEPFVETKETIGGYYLLELENDETASRLARSCPLLTHQFGSIEIRKIETT